MKRGTPLTKEYLDPKFKQIDDRFKHIESTFVTKDHFDKTLSNFVTKDHFDKEIRSVRSILHESITISMDNMKEYYKEETERYLGALMENYRQESAVMKENLTILNDKSYDFEERISVFETARA